METHKALTWVRSSYLGTKISLYLERRRQFRKDYLAIMVSLRFRPNNWGYYKFDRMHGGVNGIFKISNGHENMELWLGNGLWGMHFIVDGRYWGGVVIMGWTLKWRRELYQQGQIAILTDWVKAYDKK